MSEIAKLFSNFFEGIDVRGRLFVAAILLLVVLAVYAGFEYVTGFSYYQGLERKVTLLKELNNLAKDGIASRPELNPIYQQTLSELTERRIVPLVLPSVSFFGSIELLKFFTGGSIGLLFFLLSLVGLIKYSDESSKKNALFGALLFGFLSGIVGLLVPIIVDPILNYIGVPIVTFVLLLLWSNMQKSKSKPPSAS